jgi:PiT family inorganic phosphate transporter
VTEIQSAQGFSAETSSSATILASSYFGFSLSTTQVVSGGVMGSGLGRRGGVVHWNVVGQMVIAWILTLPCAGLMGAVAEEATDALGNSTGAVIVVALIALALAGSLFVLARRDHVGADNVVADEPRPVRPAPAPA